MSYLTQSKIAASPGMYARVAQAAASEGEDQPDSWAAIHSRQWAAAPGWDAAWESAMVGHEDDSPPYDPGINEAVITDGMILATIQPMLGPSAG